MDLVFDAFGGGNVMVDPVAAARDRMEMASTIARQHRIERLSAKDAASDTRAIDSIRALAQKWDSNRIDTYA